MAYPFAKSVADSALDLGEAAMNSAVTIAARLPILSGHLVHPSAAGAAEWRNAASEKTAAIWDGAAAACLEWQRFFWQALTTPMTPMAYAEHAMVVSRAAIHPAHVRVRANAERFRAD